MDSLTVAEQHSTPPRLYHRLFSRVAYELPGGYHCIGRVVFTEFRDKFQNQHLELIIRDRIENGLKMESERLDGSAL